jgi:acyl-CoA reductase-like NAD-dependent aldehyde dehydrogenase
VNEMEGYVEPYIVGGRPRRSPTNHPVRNPFTGSAIGCTWIADAQAIDAALEDAVNSERTCRSLPAYERAAICRRVAESIDRDRDELADLITAEAGKPVRASRAEVERAILCFETAAAEALRINGEMLPLDVVPGAEKRWAVTRHEPAGSILAITPFNFPLNLVAHKLAPAIALGAPVVLKPAPQAPLAGLRLCRYVLEAGWPPRALSAFVVDPKDHESLVADERTAVLSFTGSADVGWLLKSKAGRKKVLLELGGNAAVIVDADVDVSVVARRICDGGFGYSGQTCISVQRVLAHPGVRESLVEELKTQMAELVVGDPADGMTDVGPMITAAATQKAMARVEDAVASGAVRLRGTSSITAQLFEPTLLDDTPLDCSAWSEEIFAPVIALGPQLETFAEAVTLANRSRFGLQVGVFSQRLDHALAAFDELRVGAVILNDVPTWRVDPMPYGGVKWSGLGREGIRFAIDEYGERKMLVMNGEVR